jgi:hypothetical protein
VDRLVEDILELLDVDTRLAERGSSIGDTLCVGPADVLCCPVIASSDSSVARWLKHTAIDLFAKPGLEALPFLCV